MIRKERRWEITYKHEEFKRNKLHLIEDGCTDNESWEVEAEFGEDKETAVKTFEENYAKTEVLIRQDISEVIEYALEFYDVEIDEDGDEDETYREIYLCSRINLTAWADYRNDETKEVITVEKDGFSSYNEAKEWLDEQWDAHDSSTWTELRSCIC